MTNKFTVGMRFKMPLEREDLHSREKKVCLIKFWSLMCYLFYLKKIQIN